MHHDMKPVAAIALRAGWTITINGKGHLKWKSPEGKMVVTAATPKGRQSVYNARKDLRRAGLVLEGDAS
ncbi:MAG: hypothetical protein HC794_00780 [Nitrospiraceae bacterium]|nr:hypothetical protein [Nitrospiraceae bacterium]